MAWSRVVERFGKNKIAHPVVAVEQTTHDLEDVVPVPCFDELAPQVLPEASHGASDHGAP